MSLPNYIQKTLVIKPEVTEIFNDLDEWLDHCRMNLINYDPYDLYKSKDYKLWKKEKEKTERYNRRTTNKK